MTGYEIDTEISEVVARLDKKRRVSMFGITLIALACVAILAGINIQHTRAYLVDARAACKQDSEIDARFAGVLRNDKITGRMIADEADKARVVLLNAARTLGGWSPYAYAEFDKALHSALENHAKFYETVKLECEKDYPDVSAIQNAWQRMKSGYKFPQEHSINDVKQLPRLTSVDAERCMTLVWKLCEFKEQASQTRDYCRGMENWYQSYVTERNRLSDALRILRSEESPSYDSYQAVAGGVGERQTLRSILEELSPPAQFIGVHIQTMSAMDTAIECAQYLERYAYMLSNNYGGYYTAAAGEYKTKADILGARVVKGLESAWKDFGTLKLRYDQDPMQQVLQ